jgi:starch-binding outer membrane protein, SusD/RagB family
MKNILLKTWIVALVISFSSCVDLEEKPVGLLAPETLFQTPRDVEVAILGAYGWIASERLYGRQFVSALMLRSDMVDIGDRGTPAERQQVNDFNMDPNNGMVRAFWPYWYQTISAANAAISGAESITAAPEVANALIAEARFVRAFSYYHLVRVFGEIPYIDYFVRDPQAVADISKTPVETVYQGIIADLQFAKEWLPDNWPNNIKSRPTKGTAASYLASVYLTRENWQGAYTEAKWVIDNKSRFGYVLEADYQNLYRSLLGDRPEHIFTVDFLGSQNGGGGANDDLMAPMSGIRGADHQGWSVLVPSMQVYNEWDNRDYRKWVSFDDSIAVKGVLVPYTKFDNTQRPHIAKYSRYPGNASGDGRYSDHNYSAFRYAEVLLIAAEAGAEVNGVNAEVVGYINQIRERARNWGGQSTAAYPENVPAGLSKSQFIDLVLEERRLELSFEYKRWYDIKRRQLGEQVFKGPNAREPQANFNSSRDYLFPLPARDLDINPNLLPQNPGY